jgi:hypothetical protein
MVGGKTAQAEGWVTLDEVICIRGSVSLPLC